ncbi:MAG TPA: Uma2 family endonuclease [Planctomycetaceae bacterium]|nr:Uma2 family endonuclease [Planctomycetaceae bacterium]
MSTSTLMTAEQLFELSPRLARAELIEGELREMSPSSLDHIIIAGRLITRLGAFVYERQLGEVGSSEGGFIIQRDPDTVLAPDVVFISQKRLAQIRGPKGFAVGTPDLAVEVLSPDDRPKELERKAERWVNADVRLVWVINPRSRTAMIYRPGVDPVTISADDDLTGEDVVPGFRCRLGGLLP